LIFPIDLLKALPLLYYHSIYFLFKLYEISESIYYICLNRLLSINLKHLLMRKLTTTFIVLLTLLMGTAKAQVIFDPATYSADSLPAGMTLDTIDGEVYLQVILNEWSTWLNFYDDAVTVTGRTQFKTTAKYAVGASGEHVDTIGTYFKLLDDGDATIVAGRQPSDTMFREYTLDGMEDSTVVNQIQFAGQLQKGGWPALVGDTLWVGKIVAQDPDAFLDPLLVPTDSLV